MSEEITTQPMVHAEGRELSVEECIGGVAHDFMEPVVVKSHTWFLLFWTTSAVAFSFCRTCGAVKMGGYS